MDSNIEFMRIGKLTESDFDSIIKSAGGDRLSLDASKETTENADYIIDNAIIELKIIEEEGLEKQERQQKLANLFKKYSPKSPTIVLDNTQLPPDDLETYFNIMSTPIKTAVKKAAKQLYASKNRINNNNSCGLILINGGYGALSHEEFKEIALRRATQDTSKIDFMIIGGIYFYSDGADNYTLCPFEIISLDINKDTKCLTQIKTAWSEFVERFMTSAIKGYADREAERLPLVDFEYEIEGVRYVKPSPKMGKPSAFFPKGRPRGNSTGMKVCPPLAHTFPKLTCEEWGKLKNLLPDSYYLKNTFSEWLSYEKESSTSYYDKLKPFVPMSVQTEDFIDWCESRTEDNNFHALCLYASDLFSKRVKYVTESAIDIDKNPLILPEYILFIVEEIGQDVANDYGSIIHVSNNFEKKQQIIIIENTHFFYEYGIAVASTYAVKMGLSAVLYKRNREYVWE